MTARTSRFPQPLAVVDVEANGDTPLGRGALERVGPAPRVVGACEHAREVHVERSIKSGRVKVVRAHARSSRLSRGRSRQRLDVAEYPSSAEGGAPSRTPSFRTTDEHRHPQRVVAVYVSARGDAGRAPTHAVGTPSAARATATFDSAPPGVTRSLCAVSRRPRWAASIAASFHQSFDAVRRGLGHLAVHRTMEGWRLVPGARDSLSSTHRQC